jgi:hypothetical protein
MPFTRPEDSLPCSQEPSPREPIMSQMNPAHIHTPYLFKIHFSITSQLNMYLPSGLFFSSFLAKIAHLLHALCPTYPVRFNHPNDSFNLFKALVSLILIVITAKTEVC